jgi:hypothetical protein
MVGMASSWRGPIYQCRRSAIRALELTTGSLFLYHVTEREKSMRAAVKDGSPSDDSESSAMRCSGEGFSWAQNSVAPTASRILEIPRFYKPLRRSSRNGVACKKKKRFRAAAPFGRPISSQRSVCGCHGGQRPRCGGSPARQACDPR